MFDTVSVFEVLAADDQEHRTASRKALALAKVRVDNNLGRFLRAAQSEEEFEERLALVLDDFTHIVANSSAEVGHEHPEHIAAALKDHYRVTSKIAADDEVNFAKTPAEDDEDDDEEDNKPPWLKAKSHKVACGPCDDGDCKDCSGGDCHCSKCHKESHWVPRAAKLLSQEERDAFSDRARAHPKVAKLAAPWDQGYEDIYNANNPQAPQQAAPVEDPQQEQAPQYSDIWHKWPDGSPRDNPTGEGYIGPDGHYIGRPDQPPSGGYPSMDFRPVNDPAYQAAANNPADQDDHSSRLVSCPECGGDGKTAGNSKCGKCKGKGKVPNFGDRLLDATLGHWHVVADEDITGLGGPEPKMDKGKWTPTNPSKYKEDSKRHPTVEKDIMEPIKAVNDDPLKEIGEKTTEEEKLPTATEKDNAGFQSGGEESGPHTDTWHGNDGQVDPVTHEKQSKAADDPYTNPLRELLNQDGPADSVIAAAFAALS